MLAVSESWRVEHIIMFELCRAGCQASVDVGRVRIMEG